MVDSSVVNLPSVFATVVRSYDAAGNEIEDDGEWHRGVAETHFVLAEFLASKGVIAPEVVVGRRNDLVIRMSELSELGQAFVMSQAVYRWMGSLDRRKPGTPITADGLERRWATFLKQRSTQ